RGQCVLLYRNASSTLSRAASGRGEGGGIFMACASGLLGGLSILGFVVALAGCDAVSDVLGGDKSKKSAPPSGPPPEAAEQALKRMQTEECKRLSTQPDTLLETSDLKYYYKGIINDYRQL